MNKRDVVKSAIAHKDCNQVPFYVHFGSAFEKYPEELYKKYATPGMKKLEQAGIISKGEAMTLGMGNFVCPLNPPWWNWYNVPSSYKTDFDPPDFLPKTIGGGSYDAFIEKVKVMKELTGGYILAQIYGSHFEKAYFSRGIENFLADMAGAPEFAKKLLNKIISKNLVMLENIVAIPEIDGVLLGSDWGSQKNMLMNPDTWREMIAPGEQKEYDLIKSEGKDVWIHSCGNIEQIIPDLVEMGVDVLNPVQPECMDIYKLKDNFGEKLTFWGGISTQQTLPYGTPDEVRTESRKVIEYMSKGGGYISSPAQTLQDDVPLENIFALMETCQSYVESR